jgi:hypothetical protein
VYIDQGGVERRLEEGGVGQGDELVFLLEGQVKSP